MSKYVFCYHIEKDLDEDSSILHVLVWGCYLKLNSRVNGHPTQIPEIGLNGNLNVLLMLKLFGFYLTLFAAVPLSRASSAHEKC